MNKAFDWESANTADPMEDLRSWNERTLAQDGLQLPNTPRFCDIDLDNWKTDRYSDLLTGTLWQFPSRDKSHGHDGSYHGNFIPQVVNQVLRRYTHRGDLVLDLFIGSGTTAIECLRLGRRCLGIDIQQNLVDTLTERFLGTLSCYSFLQADSASPTLADHLKGLPFVSDRLFDLVMLHPPYWRIIEFSTHASDMSNMPTLDTFVHKFYTVAKNAYQLLAPGRFACLVIGDMYEKGEVIPLSFLCMAKMLEAGFIVKAINVKDIQGNEKGKGKDGPLWRYRALKFGFQVFEHEYVMIFEKREKGRSQCADVVKQLDLLP